MIETIRFNWAQFIFIKLKNYQLKIKLDTILYYNKPIADGEITQLNIIMNNNVRIRNDKINSL